MAEKSSGFHSRRTNSNSVRGRKETHDKCLEAIKEDLASWFTRLLGTAITLETFTSALGTGVVLCQLANLIQADGEDYVAKHSDIREDCFPRSGTTFKKRTAFPGSFIARDNVANFIRWCRELGVPDTIMFESDDVVLEKNEKRVLLTLLEVARRAARFGVDPPDLIRMENEIDQEMDEIAADAQAQLESPVEEHVILTQRKLSRKKSHSLDDLVYQVLEQCTCAPVKYQVVRIAEGKYRMGEQKTLIFVRVMRKNVMVRVGGGWDTLERYFDKHDPCRMQEPRQRRGSAKIPRGNEVFTRSPSSLSLGSVSSTDSQDSFNTATTSSSSHLSGTWPAQPTKRPRDVLVKQRARNPPSSPLLGQSRPSRRTGATSRGPPRTIETQARNRRSKSMHELSKLSVEEVMGPTYTKQTNSSVRKQSVGAQAQVRRQSVASSKTGSNGISGREPTPQKPFCSTVSRSSSFGSCPRPAPYCRPRTKSSVEAPSRNGLSYPGSSVGREAASSEQDEKQRKARERSRTAQRDARKGSTRRGRSTPREVDLTQTTPREGSRTLPRREGNYTPLQERNNNTSLRERSRTPQRKLSKASDGKQSTPSDVSPRQSKLTRPSKQTRLHREQTKTPEQKLSERTEDKMNEDLCDSKSSTLTSPESQSGEENAPVLVRLEREQNGTKESEQRPRSGEDHSEVNDEETIRGLYEKLIIDKEESAKEADSLDVRTDTRNGSLTEESSKVDGTTEEIEWNNDCLRHVRVIDFSETEKDCNEKQVVEDLELEASELKNMLFEGGEEFRGQTVNSDLGRNGRSSVESDTTQVSSENGSPQVSRRRPQDLNLSPAPRDRVAMATTQQPSQKARESDSDALSERPMSNRRRRAMNFDVDQYSRISGDSDSASTPESPSDSPKKLSLVQSMISSIESRTNGISPRAKPAVTSTGKGTQGRPAGMQPKTCAKDGSRLQTTVEESVNAGNKNGFQSSRSTDDIQRTLRSPTEKIPNTTPANYNHTSEPAVTLRDRPEGSEHSKWRNEYGKDSLKGNKEARHTTKKTGNFPKPQGQFTLEEMIEDMMPQEQEKIVLGRAVPQSLARKHGYDG